MASKTRFLLRSDSERNWKNADPVLFKGEPAYDLTNNELKFGDGVKHWSEIEPIAGNIDIAVVDSLIKGGTDRALSAEQGKLLNTRVNKLEARDNLRISTLTPYSVIFDQTIRPGALVYKVVSYTDLGILDSSNLALISPSSTFLINYPGILFMPAFMDASSSVWIHLYNATSNTYSNLEVKFWVKAINKVSE